VIQQMVGSHENVNIVYVKKQKRGKLHTFAGLSSKYLPNRGYDPSIRDTILPLYDL
jgi:hypothetical protein